MTEFRAQTSDEPVPVALAGTPVSDDDRLQLVLSAGDMGTWDWDLHTGRIRWDEQTAAIFGVALSDFDGTFEMFRSRMLLPEDAHSVTAAIEHAIATRGAFRRDYRVVHPDGSVRWVSARGRVLCDEHGEPLTMAGVVQDRTEAHSLEERLARTLEHIDEAFYSLDAQWRFTFVNAQAEQVLQRNRDELLGEVLWERFPEAAGGPFDVAFKEAVATGAPVTFEEFYEPLGVWVELRAYPEPAGLSVYFRDITARKAAEQQRQEQLAVQERTHRAAADVLDLAARLNSGLAPAAAAAVACAAGAEIFECTFVSVWRIDDDAATLLAQHGGDPVLAAGASLSGEGAAALRAAVRARRPTFVPDALELAATQVRHLARQLGVRSLVQAPVPLGVRGETQLTVLGWDAVIDPPATEMLDVAQQFSQQVALSVEQARRGLAESEVTGLNAELQASLLPSPAVRGPGVEVASLYRPGERRLKLGGDFYDVVRTPSGALSAVIGDVTGHGPDAAALGVALRAGWRMLALRETPPAAIVAGLDALLRTERDTDEQLVTVCCVELDPSRTTLSIVRAGHPAPIVATTEGAGLVEAPAGLLLGSPVRDVEWEATPLTVAGRWALLLYTDGLTDARAAPDTTERLGEERLADHLADLRPLDAPNLDALLQRLHVAVRNAAAEPLADDVALLLLRHPGPVRAD